MNEAPVLDAIADQVVNELTAFSLTVNGSDVDANTILTYTLEGTVPAGLSISGNQLTWTPTEAQDGEYTITVRVSDGQLSDSKSFKLTVKEVNEAPVLGVIGNREIRLGEGLSFTVSGSDSDRVSGVSNTLSYSLVGTVPSGAEINSSSGLFSWTPSAVGNYTITVAVNDNQGQANSISTREFTVTVIRANEAPTDIVLSHNHIYENNEASAIVGLLSSVDPNNGDSHTYSLVSGAGDTDNGLFSIDGNKLLIGFTADYENVTTQKREYSIRVKTTDNGTPSKSYEKSFTIRILDKNEAPTAINISGTSVNEGSGYGVVVGELSAVDPDAGQSHSYELTNDAGGRFALAFADGKTRVIVNNGSLLDYETDGEHTIRVKATDSGNPQLSYERDIVITVLNVNEAPIFTSEPVTSAQPNFEYRYIITTGDPEGDARVITASGLPAWLTFTDNRDGTATLSGTPSDTDGGIYTIQLVVKERDTAEQLSAVQNVLIGVDSVLRELDRFSPEQVMQLVIPNDRSVLEFRIKDLFFDETDRQGINDAFEVALLDGNNQSLVFTVGEGKDSFINFTEGEGVQLATGVSYDATTGVVSLNMVGIEAGTPAKLVIRLVNNDTDTGSYVEVANIRLSDAPADWTAPVANNFALFSARVAETPRIDFAGLGDVTPSVQAEYKRTSFAEGGKVLRAEFGLQNIGTYAVEGPVVVAVRNISDASVSLRNASGVTPDGFAYIDVTPLLSNGKLDPSGLSELGELVFNNPNEVQFSYELQVLGRVNRAPQITSNPLLPGRDVAEVVGGKVYTYDVEAKDLDNDTLTYALLVAPEGLSIDSETGLIRWSTQEANIGNHSIVVEVSDGRGGIDIQSYTLSVIAQPPNRPPIFTTDPVVDAYINQLYRYDADAIDPDQDEVTYSLIIGPNGMTVNRDTGVVEWTPPAALIIGDTVLGRVRVPGENDEFTFSGVAGQRIYLDPLTYAGNLGDWNVRVITPSGREILSRNLATEGSLLTLDETGNYRIVVDAQGDRVGNYAFRLIDPSLVPIIEYDAIITDKLAPGNQDRLYRFTAAKGQRLFFDSLSTSSPNLDWVVYDSKNGVVASQADVIMSGVTAGYSAFSDLELLMPQDGEYILAVRGKNGFTNSIDYSFSLVNSDVVTRQVRVDEVVEGTIAKKGGRHTLEFNATAGQQVFFDGLDGNANLRYAIIDPFGDVVRTGTNAATAQQGIDIRYDRGFLDGFTFAFDGKYKILVDGSGETTGKYKFRLIDKASAEAYTIDELLEGTVDFNATGAKLFKFTVQPNMAPNNVDPNQRQYVYLDGLMSQSYYTPRVGDWVLFNANGQQLATAELWQDSELWLTAGDYYLAIKGDPVSNGYGVNPNYKFRVITSDTPTGDITSQIYTTASNGQVIEGNIAKKGSFDTYTFTGRAGQQLFFDPVDNSTYFTYDLISPNGTVLVNDADIRFDRFFLDGFSLPIDGLYKLVVASDAREETGAYKFRLLDIGSGTPYTLDTVIDATLGNGGFNTDFYSFELTNDTYLYFDFTGQAGQSGSWHLFNDSGVEVTSGDNLATDRELSVKAGKYILAVRGGGTAGANNYRFSVITPEFTTQSLSFDTVVSGAIAEKGEWDTYTFTANAGEQLWFDSLDGNTAGITYTLYTPQGNVLVDKADIRFDRRMQDGLIAPVSGMYKLVVDGTGEATGNYKFQLLSKGTAVASLNTDEVGTFTNNGTSAKLYQFTLTGKQYVYIDANPTNQANQNGNWILYAPNGDQITWGSLTQDYERWLEAGTYTLAVQGTGASSTSYGIRIITPELTTTPLTLGQEYVGTISEKGEWDSYTFTGTAGQLLYLDLINRGNAQTTRVSLTDEHGRVLFSRWVSDNDPDAFVLSYTGRYTLTFDGDGEKTDSYSFRLLDLATASDITANIGKGGAISNIVYNGSAYKLSNAVGWEAAQAEAQSLGGNLVTINDAAEEVFVYNQFPSNYYIGLTDKDVEGQWKWISGEPVTYTNWAPGEPNNSGGNEDYAQFWGGRRWNDNTGGGERGIIEVPIQITVDPTVNSGTLTDGRATQIYKFNATAGQALVLTPVTAPADTTWTVYSPSGEVLMNANTNTIQTLVAKADGVYTLAIRGNAQATANFSFTVSELKEGGVMPPPATAINFNQAYSGSLSSGQTARFTFTGTAGQNLFYDAQGGANVGLTLIDPFGRQVVSNANSAVDQRTGFTLTSNGTYTLVLGGAGTGSYQFQLLNMDSGTALPVGTDVNGTIGNASQQVYKLELAEKSVYYLDAKFGNGNIYVYKPNGDYVTRTDLQTDTYLLIDTAGAYYFVVEGTPNSNYGFRIELADTPAPMIGYGEKVEGVLSIPYDTNRYTFTAEVGDWVIYDFLSSSDYRTMGVQILDPYGKSIHASYPRWHWAYGYRGDGIASQTEFIAMTSGTYSVVISDQRGSGGSYSFRVIKGQDAQRVALGDYILKTDASDASHYIYQFDNPVGQWVYIDASVDVNHTNPETYYGLRRVDGSTVVSDSVLNNREVWLEAGTYFLQIEGGLHSIRLTTPSHQDLGSLQYGEVISGDIAGLGDRRSYSFAGRAGDVLYFDSLSGTNGNVMVQIYDQNGRLVKNMPSNADDGLFILTEDGTYRVVVDGYFSTFTYWPRGRRVNKVADNTGSYSFRIVDVKDAPQVSLGDTVQGVADYANGVRAYKITVPEKTYTYFDSLASWSYYGGNSNWDYKLFRADGSYVWGQFAGRGHMAEGWLESGEYYLVFVPRNGSAGEYKVELGLPSNNVASPISLSLNSVVSGEIEKRGEKVYYQFAGQAGQRLWFDGLNGVDNIYVQIYDPVGRLLIDNPDPQNVSGRGIRTIWDWGTNGGLTLPMDGVYTVVVDGLDTAWWQGWRTFNSYQVTGAYNFRLHNLEDKPAVGFDTEISGVFDSGARGAEAYQFSLDRPTYLYFDAKQGDGSWGVYKRNGNLVTSGRLWEDRELLLDAGDYSLVFWGAGSASNYNLVISRPELPTFSYQVGDMISGSITKAGDQHAYKFAGKAGQVLYLDSQSKVNGFRVRITAPSGKSLIGDFDTFNSDDKDFIILSETGEYTLTVDPVNDVVGDYRLRLIEYGDKATMPTQIVLNATNPTATVTGAFEDANRREVDVYRFTSAGKQNLFVDVTGDGNHWWAIYKPNGENLIWGRLTEDKEVYLEAEGQYTLVLWGGGSANNAYEVNLNLSHNDVRGYALGTVVSSSLALKGETDTYTFSGSAGQLLFFDAMAGNSNITAKLYDEAGTLVADRHTGTDWQVSLGSSGTYRLVIDGVGATTGNYSFVVRDVASVPAIQVGVPVEATLSAGNGQAVYRIAGRAGQVLRFDLDAPTWQGANWVLYDPSGVVIAQPNATAPDFQVALAGDGNYSLVISGSSSNPVPYRFTVTDVTPVRVNSSGLGVVRSGTFNTANQVDEYTFTANAGAVIWLDSMTGSPDWRDRVEILNPDGTRLMEGELRYDYGTYVLQQTGTYKVRVRDWYGQATGRSYSFQVLELPKGFGRGVHYLEIGEAIAGVSEGGKAKVYTLPGVAGMQLMFNGMAGSGVHAWLYDVNGNLVSSIGNFGSQDSGLTTLRSDQVYNLVIGGNSGQNNSYAFQVLGKGESPELQLNLVQRKDIADGRQSFMYRMHGEKGQKLYFDNLSLTGAGVDEVRWQLYSPSGVRLTDQGLGRDFEYTLAESGEYVLYVAGRASSAPYSYSFRVFSHEVADANSLDVLVPGDGSGTGSGEADGSLGWFQVVLAAQDEHGAETQQRYTIRLWPQPDNANPVIISQADTRHDLRTAGYLYQLQALDGDGDALVWRLLDGPEGAMLNSDTGELVWIPGSGVRDGDVVSFKVEVNDRKGGKDVQEFAVQVYSALGNVKGFVFEDLNGNGIRDTKLIKGENPAVVFAIDVSGSTVAPFYGRGEYEHVKTVLDAQIAATKLVIESLIAQGAGDKVKVGIIAHEYNALIQDMDLATDGVQLYTTPLADSNNNGILDVYEILDSYRAEGNNRFVKALEQMEVLLEAYDGTPNLIFMADGYSRDSREELARVGSELRAVIEARGGNMTAFAIGEKASLDVMRAIDPNAELLSDIHQLGLIFSGLDERYAIEPLMKGINVYVDGNGNSELDSGERYIVTANANFEPNVYGQVLAYQYEFTDFLPGNHRIEVVVPEGYEITTPSGGGFNNAVTVAGERYVNIFGLHKTAPAPNRAPEFQTQPQALYRLEAGQLLRYEPRVMDANGDVVSFDLLLAPEGMTVDASTGVVVWQPTAQQVERYYKELRDKLATLDGSRQQTESVKFQVLVRAKDGKGGVSLQALNIELLESNYAPVFVSELPLAQVSVGQVYQHQVRAIDPEGTAVQYELVRGFAGLSIDRNTGWLSWTPTAVGQGGVVEVRAIDRDNQKASQTFRIEAVGGIANRPPIVASEGRSYAQVGNNYLYQIVASDADGDRLSYRVVSAPNGVSVNGDGIVLWTPSANQQGRQEIAVEVSDGRGGVHLHSWEVKVSPRLVNGAPAIVSVPVTVSNLEKGYRYAVEAVDPDGDVLLWELVEAPRGMVIDRERGVIGWQARTAQVGKHRVVVAVEDVYGGRAEQAFELEVRGTNTPPRIYSQPLTVVGVGQGYEYKVVATDIDGTELSYSLSRAPEGMTIDERGVVHWVPKYSGKYSIAVVVRDEQGGSASQEWAVEVRPQPVNRAPEIMSSAVLVSDVSGYRYQLDARDADGDSLGYELVVAPAGMTVDGNGLIQWVPSGTGSYDVVVRVQDGRGGTGTQSFKLRVINNQAPIIGGLTPDDTAVPGYEYRYDVYAYDPDGYGLSYEVDSATAALGVTIDQSGRLRWKPAVAQLGSHELVVIVKDNLGLEARKEFRVAVAVDTQAPLVSMEVAGDTYRLAGDERLRVRVGSGLQVFVNATDNTEVSAVRLWLDGEELSLGGKGIATITVNETGERQLRAEAVDAFGNRRQVALSLVVDPLTVPEETDSLNFAEGVLINDVIRRYVDITGTMNDPQMGRYVLEVRPVGSGEEGWQVMFQGTTPVENGVLGGFDPTRLPDGSYEARMSVFSGSGELLTQKVMDVDVMAPLKLGAVNLSFLDMEVRLGGIGIPIVRTYNSLNLDQHGDYGYGWRMELGRVGIRMGRIPQTGAKEGFRVFVTMPDGTKEVFRLVKADGHLVNDILRAFRTPDDKLMWKPQFVAEGNSGLVLSVPQPILKWEQDGTLKDWVSGEGYDPRAVAGAWVVTDKAGTRYEINPASGELIGITTTEGDRVDIRQSGIRVGNQQLEIERDSSGRVRRITDSTGAKVSYEYNAAGDLVRVVDKDGKETRFEYHDRLAHYLVSIKDGLGQDLGSYRYDAQGRLVGVTDELGNLVQGSYDPANFQEVITDGMGYQTTYIYDQYGNVVEQRNPDGGVYRWSYSEYGEVLTATDPYGNTTNYSYDAQGRVTSITDALGHKTQLIYEGDGVYEINPLGNMSYRRIRTSGLVSGGQVNTGEIFRVENGDGTVQSGQIRSLGDDSQVYEITASVNGDVLVRQKIDFGYADGRVLEEEVNGRKVRYTYDSAGRVVEERLVVDATTEAVTSYAYDAQGRLIRVTDAVGRSERIEYDSAGNVVALTNYRGERTGFLYDHVGRLIGKDYSDGSYERYFYNEKGLLVRTAYSDGTEELYEYNNAGQVVRATNRDGQTVRYTYDVMGRVTRTELADGTYEEKSYDLMGRVVRQRNADGSQVEYEYDAVGNVSREVRADGTVHRYRYDGMGNVIEHIFRDGENNERSVQYVRNERGEVTQFVMPDGTIFEATVPEGVGLVSGGYRTESFLPTGGPNRLTYNYNQQITAVQDASGNITVYEYDGMGNLIAETDANGNRTRYRYNLLGQRVAKILPNGAEQTYEYDADGRLVGITNFAGERSSFVVDDDNGQVRVNYASGSYQVTAFDMENLRLERQENEYGRIEYGYDAEGRLVRVRNDRGQVVQYQYDAQGQLTQVISPNSTTTYAYNSDGYLLSVSDSKAGTTSYEYDSEGRLVAINKPNGMRREYVVGGSEGYQLTVVDKDSQGSVVFKEAYKFDAQGRLVQLGELSRVVLYTYNDLDQLVKEQVQDLTGGVLRETSYTYDALGNRLRRQDSLEGVTEYEYNGLNQLVRETKGSEVIQYTYDANGRRVRKETAGVGVTLYRWQDDKLVEVRKEDATGALVHKEVYTYDARGLLRSRRVNDGAELFYVMDYNQPYAHVREVVDGSGNVVEVYHNALNGDAPDARWRNGVGVEYLHQGWHDSTRVISDASGQVTDRYTYDAYGRVLERQGSSDNPYLYNGELYNHDTGLQYLRARFLDIQAGQFVSRDPYEGELENPVSRNGYQYVHGNPVAYTDPSGNVALVEYAKTNVKAAVTNIAALTAKGFALFNKYTHIYNILVVLFTLLHASLMAFPSFLTASANYRGYVDLASKPALDVGSFEGLKIASRLGVEFGFGGKSANKLIDPKKDTTKPFSKEFSVELSGNLSYPFKPQDIDELVRQNRQQELINVPFQLSNSINKAGVRIGLKWEYSGDKAWIIQGKKDSMFGFIEGGASRKVDTKKGKPLISYQPYATVAGGMEVVLLENDNPYFKLSVEGILSGSGTLNFHNGLEINEIKGSLSLKAKLDTVRADIKTNHPNYKASGSFFKFAVTIFGADVSIKSGGPKLSIRILNHLILG